MLNDMFKTEFETRVDVVFCNLFIFPRTDLYIHDSIYTIFSTQQLQ
jgi:hypothetical protein